MSQSHGGRRLPPGAQPQGGGGGGPASNASPKILKPNAAPFVPGGGSNANAAPFVPGGGAAAVKKPPLPTPAAGSGGGAASLNAGAAAFVPKFGSGSGNTSQNNSPGSLSGSNKGSPGGGGVADEPSAAVVHSATASISPEVAKVKAAKSSMSAGATAFTPVKSDGGSFPSTPSKNNQQTPGAATGSPTSPNRPPPPPAPPAPMLPDPFKGSQIEVPAKAKPVPQSAVNLNTSWTLYADFKPASGPQLGGAVPGKDGKPGSGGKDEDEFAPVRLASISDIESFWRLQRSVPTPASRVPRFTYYFFRKTIYPSWEEPRNKHGGTFSFLVWDSRTNSDSSRDVVNDVWTLLLAGLAGESIDESTCINGVCLKVRSRISIEIWTNVCTKARVQQFVVSLREMLKKRLSAFPTDRQVGTLDFTSNETNVARSAVPASPAGGRKGPAPAQILGPNDFSIM